MDQDTKVVQELKELKQKVASLEDLLLAERKEKVGPGRTFIDAILSLLFGLFVVGPVVVVVIGVLMIVMSWLG
ncbi:hypothetical protein [Peribacillus sp. NPDC097295]|uniref:hypothetical protein n=1 Tax=Peribacillus sp. NPDC097295 TaxID=3364402 RepID=UPI003830A94B